LCRLLQLLQPAASVMDLNIGAALWLAARAEGTLHLPTAYSPAVHHDSKAAGEGALGTQVPSTTPQAASAASIQASGSAACTAPSDAARAQQADGHDMAARRGARGHGARYASRARVALLGTGADEVFGGYGRHRTAYSHGGLQGLQAELEVDMRRLWLRNLGRDDRLVADASREARHPFLDEELLAAVARLPLEDIVDPTLPIGVGDKRVLRGVARRLGLARAAARAKRAIQFGSRIGRLSNVRDFGSNRAANRQKAGSVALRDV
jgi:asparagine synthetase B (glutamine-hydrolysing)